LAQGDKLRFLASLSHALTVAGRAASYEFQGDGLTRPDFLRSIDEIQHHVSACITQVLIGERSEDFERSIAHSVLETADKELRSHTVWAWQDAKSHIALTRD
jgi:pheromone shutdown protein TraB